MSVEFVIAKYQEDISWVDHIDSAKYKVTIYDKSTNGNLPNVGREAHTYLHHIINKYDRLADTTVFVQGNPFDHLSISREDLLGIINSYHYSVTEPFFNTRRIHESSYLCQKTYRAIFDDASFNEEIYFTDGAQWIVKKENILNKPLSLWDRIYNEVSKQQNTNWEDVINPWTLEGVWQFLFDYTARS